MKYCFITALLLFFFYQSRCNYHNYLTNPVAILGGVSLFCLLTYGKDTIDNMCHKECVLLQTEKRYINFFDEVEDDDNILLLKTEQTFKEMNRCDKDISLITGFLAKRYKCSIENVYDIEYKKKDFEGDSEYFAAKFYYEKIKIPLLGTFVGLLGLSITIYNFCNNNYKL